MNKNAYIPLGGGIDLVTPPRQMKPGQCLYAVNYECPVSGGYRRIAGYAAVGPVVPGEGPLLGVVTFADRYYAVRKDTGADAATLYRYNSDTNTWDSVGACHNGRYEFVEGNLTATEKGRALYGVGGGKPFQLLASPGESVEYQSILGVVSALRGNLPSGVVYIASNDKLIISDTKGRNITGLGVFDKADASLTTGIDKTGNGDDTTQAEIDLSDQAPNSIGYVRFTVGEEAETELAIPELASPFYELSAAQSGAQFIALHANHLFIGFPSGSLQHSSIGKPNSWNAAVGGAGEIGVGQPITGLLNGRGGTLHILCRDSIKTLYGSSTADWQLKITIPNSGAKPYSAQNLLQPYFIAERGITNLQATDQFGDFQPLQAGAMLEPLFTEDGWADRVVCSVISKRRAQYRVFFDDGSGVYMSPTGATTVLFPDAPVVAHSGELDSGEEVVLFGDANGQVYRLGNNADSFAGNPISAFLTLAYTDLRKPAERKRFRRVFWDVRSGSNADITFRPDFDFGGIESAPHLRQTLSFLLGGGLWDVARWNEFAWSAPVVGQEAHDITGSGTSINFAIYSSSISPPHEILGYDLTYSDRRLRRG